MRVFVRRMLRSSSGPYRWGLTGAVLVAAALLLAVAGIALLAQPARAASVLAQQPTSIDQVLNNIRNWLVGILATLATVFFTIGGVRYLMGGGDPGEIERAKSALRAAGIGYCLAALAPLVVAVLKGIVGA